MLQMWNGNRACRMPGKQPRPLEQSDLCFANIQSSSFRRPMLANQMCIRHSREVVECSLCCSWLYECTPTACCCNEWIQGAMNRLWKLRRRLSEAAQWRRTQLAAAGTMLSGGLHRPGAIACGFEPLWMLGRRPRVCRITMSSQQSL